MVRVCLWAGVIALALSTFIVVTHEMIVEHDAADVDRAILTWLSKVRTPRLTSVMVDLTALGSAALVTLFTGLTLLFLLVRRDRPGALHLFVASLGGWFLTFLTKDLIERARPTEVEHLVQVSGFSYPSGHSLSAAALYLTMALVAAGRVKDAASKATLVAGASFVVLVVAMSRVYLGVHYPSDVVSGVALGTAWALILAAAFALIAKRRAHAPADVRSAR
jgi:undecaprenyl-diphosphatase